MATLASNIRTPNAPLEYLSHAEIVGLWRCEALKLVASLVTGGGGAGPAVEYYPRLLFSEAIKSTHEARQQTVCCLLSGREFGVKKRYGEALVRVRIELMAARVLRGIVC